MIKTLKEIMKFNKQTNNYETTFYDKHRGALWTTTILSILILIITIPIYWAFYLQPSAAEGIVGLKGEQHVFINQKSIWLYPSLTSSDSIRVSVWSDRTDLDAINIGDHCKINQIGMTAIASCSKP